MKRHIVTLLLSLIILVMAVELVHLNKRNSGYMLREETAVVVLRLHFGVDYIPSPALGTVFADMTDTTYWGTKWAETAYIEGFFSGCGWENDKPLFCPGGGN